MKENEEHQVFFGIWVKGQGWLRGAGGEVVAFSEKVVADSTALRLGNGARVEYIDNALRDIEQYLLSVEKIREENRWINRLKRWIDAWRHNVISR